MAITKIRGVAFDALVLGVFLLVADVVILELSAGVAAQIAIGLPLVMLLPGYAIVAALFPAATPGTHDASRPFANAVDGSLTWPERLGLSAGMSVAVMPLIGVTQSLLGIPYGRRTLLAVLNLVIVAGLAVAVVRRVRRPPFARLSIEPRVLLARVRTVTARQSRLQLGLSIALLALAVTATVAVGGAVVTPTDGEQFSSLQLLTETENGSLVTDDYPRQIAVGEQAPVVVGIDNREHHTQQYTIVTVIHRTQMRNGERVVTDTVELSRETVTLADGETLRATKQIAPTSEGEQLQYRVYLYRGDAPETPSTDTAYRHVHLWFTATGADASDSDEATGVDGEGAVSSGTGDR